MSNIKTRLVNAIVELNSIIDVIDNNDDVDFDIEKRVSVLEVSVDDLTTDVESTVEFVEDTSSNE